MEILSRAIELINSGKFDLTVKTISSFLDENPRYKTIDYLHFQNPIEEVLFDVYSGRSDSVEKLDLEESLDELYMIYGIAYMAQDMLDEAEKYLKTANQINPVSCTILMRLCELYQAKGMEEKQKELSFQIFKYTYDVDILISNYFKLADYHYHTGENMELYNHLLSFFTYLKAGQAIEDLNEDIRCLQDNNVPIGFNPEIFNILLYLIDVHEKQSMPNSVQYFKNILESMFTFQEYLESLK